MEGLIDVIKKEPEMDPLSPQKEDTCEEEGENLSMIGNFLQVDVSEIKIEPLDQSCDDVSDIKCEDNEDSTSFPVLKFEPEEESCNDTVKEELITDEVTRYGDRTDGANGILYGVT
ncbi:uncharacterized protein [Periplaneta americana]|uniref:uncharacterized protein isoform X3 n=1 Tax=Periplaneta americana TaxID=6978 RepID=UPI0037E949B6